jgi:glyoxylase-like metal-dependent hydrolase (beta-lactamase superfamily II)
MEQQIICSTCGTWYPLHSHPDTCIICSDDRQYIPEGGQRWTMPADLHRQHSTRLHPIKDRLYELEINPTFAIGQRALLVLSDHGNVLWDCIPMLDEMTTAFIHSKGGLQAIAFSHPHYYSNMNDWAATFNCPVYIHENDAEHIMVKGPHIQLWQGNELPLWDGITLHCIGGHFEGSTLMRVPFLSAEGALLCGDSLFLSPSKKHFSVLRSYPNRIPLPLSEMRRIQQRMQAISFDEFYGYVKSQNLAHRTREVFEESMKRYVE